MALDVDKAVIARYEKSGMKFELLVDPEAALRLKSGKQVEMEDLLAVREIFEDARKGMRCSREDILKAFGTADVEEVAKIIILRGNLQLTTEQRRKMLEEKKRSIASIIAREAVNPQTNTPHTIERILNAMETAKVSVDIFRDAESQVNDVLESIKRILPIRMEKAELSITVPASHAPRVYGVLREIGRLKKEEWRGDGSLSCVLEIPAGMQVEVFDRLNALTNGEVVISRKR